MDDPWGSPWATADSTSTLEPPTQASTSLELPGRALARTRSPSSISPWAVDDDALNGWTSPGASLTLPPAAATPGAGWSGWGGEHGLNASQTSLTARAREGSLGLPSPTTAWPASASLAPGQAKTVSRRSSARSLSRQPSPDPWATEFSQNRLSLPAAAHISAEQTAFSTPDSHEKAEEEKVHSNRTTEGGDARVDAVSAGDLEATPTSADEPAVEARPGSSAENEPDRQTNEEDKERLDSPSLSRRSSASHDSRREERLDSPLTSMDEDCKDRAAIPRRPSTKVQELVDKYDGLAKVTGDSLLVPSSSDGRRRSTSRSMSLRSFQTDVTSDFGDFEDAGDFDAGEPPRRPSVTGSPRPASSRAGRVRSLSRTSLRKVSVASGAAAVTSPIQEEEHSGTFQELRARFGPVSFAPDLELVDKLFDGTKLDREQPSAKDYSLDAVEGIIKDSFTTVSERKTWYRISRPGTMRKHDLGDDDTYRRVSWVGSKVREDASKIVRRWMEEGPYAGRSTAGGRSMAKGGAFNWDAKTKAEPLSFDEIFGKRKSAQPPKPAAALPRPLSLQVQPTGPAHSRDTSVGVRSLPPRSPMSIPLPPAGPAFGWSTGAASGSLTPASLRLPSEYTRPSLEVGSVHSGGSRPPSILEPPEGRTSLHLAPPPAAAPSPQPPPVKPSNLALATEDDDDDEDWGEMIASPATDGRPASGFFDSSLNGSMASLASANPAGPVSSHESPAALSAVPPQNEQSSSAAPLGDVWDFSAFDSTPAPPAVPSTTTSKPEFSFDTPLQSPSLSIPSRTGSPASVHLSKPPTPTAPLRIEPPTKFQIPKQPPTPISAVPPTRAHHTPRSSLNLARPSPLHHVITPKATSPEPKLSIKPPTKTVSFAQDDDENEPAVRRILAGLPDLSYMLR